MIRPNDIPLDVSEGLVEKLKVDNQQIINDFVITLGVTAATEAIKESSEVDNAITIASGDYGGWFSSKPGSIYKGLSAQSRVTRLVRIDQDCIMDGIHFRSSEANRLNLVFINIGATVVFRNCVFEKFSGESEAYVALGVPAAGVSAKANFIGCVFQGPNTGSIIFNPGAAANVNTIGCHDKTGVGFAGTTGVGNL